MENLQYYSKGLTFRLSNFEFSLHFLSVPGSIRILPFFGILGCRKASEVILVKKSALVALAKSATETIDDGSDRKELELFELK